MPLPPFVWGVAIGVAINYVVNKIAEENRPPKEGHLEDNKKNAIKIRKMETELKKSKTRAKNLHSKHKELLEQLKEISKQAINEIAKIAKNEKDKVAKMGKFLIAQFAIAKVSACADGVIKQEEKKALDMIYKQVYNVLDEDGRPFLEEINRNDNMQNDDIKPLIKQVEGVDKHFFIREIEIMIKIDGEVVAKEKEFLEDFKRIIDESEEL